MNQVPTARDCMSGFFTTLRADTDIYEAIDLLQRKGASGAPVIDNTGQLIGLLTEKDCLRVLSNDAYATLARGTAREYMSEVKFSVSIDDDLWRVAEMFLQTNFSVLPVMEQGKLVGRISRQDMLRGILRLQRQWAKQKMEDEREFQMTSRPSGINQLQNLFAKHKPENVAALLSTLNADNDR